MPCSSATRQAGESVSRWVRRTWLARSFEHVAHARQQTLEFVFLELVCDLRRGLAQLAGIEVALRRRLQLLAVELGQMGHDPLVDAVGQQQHLDAVLPEHLEMRAVSWPPRTLRRSRSRWRPAQPSSGRRSRPARRSARRCRCGSTQSEATSRSARGSPASSMMPSLSTRPNSFQKVAYFSFWLLRQIFEQAEHPLHGRRANLRHVGRLLQDFARHVERQIARVDDAADEAQVGRQQLLGRVHDEDAPDVELHAVAAIRGPRDRTGRGAECRRAA